jgi:hypothetical protein
LWESTSAFDYFRHTHLNILTGVASQGDSINYITFPQYRRNIGLY